MGQTTKFSLLIPVIVVQTTVYKIRIKWMQFAGLSSRAPPNDKVIAAADRFLNRGLRNDRSLT